MAQEQNSYEADKKRFRMWLAGIGFGLGLLAVAAALGRAAYRHQKELRDQAQATTFLARDDYRSALLSAREVLLLNPTNVPACRVMAALADLAHSPATLDWQRRVVETEPSVENELQLAAAGLHYQNPPFPLTTQILAEFAATNLVSYQVVAGSLALGTHRLAEAEAHFEIAARLEPTNRRYALNLAAIRLGGTNEAKADASRRVLENLCADTNLAPAAWRSLVADRLAHQDLAAANGFSTRLLASPQATLADQLQQLEILRQLNDTAFAARLLAVQQVSATRAPAAAQVAAWMQANGRLAESIRWLTGLPANLRAQPAVGLVLADGYVQAGDWAKLRDFASTGDWGDQEFLRLALVSHAWAQLGVSAVAASCWSAAVTETRGRCSALTALLGLADQWQLPIQQEELLEQIVEKYPQASWAPPALEQIYLTTGKTAELNQLYARLLSQDPANCRFKNNFAATALLLKTNLPAACQCAAEAYAQAPANPAAAATYAFALHVQGRDPDGLAVLQKLTPAQLAQPAIALYYGVLLAASGKDREAAGYFQIAQTQSQWLPEESQLLAATVK
jgi:Flp pilus assembly protein TadD